MTIPEAETALRAALVAVREHERRFALVACDADDLGAARARLSQARRALSDVLARRARDLDVPDLDPLHAAIAFEARCRAAGEYTDEIAELRRREERIVWAARGFAVTP